MSKNCPKHSKSVWNSSNWNNCWLINIVYQQGYHQLVQQQTLESEELQTDLDNAEVQDLDKLKMVKYILLPDIYTIVLLGL